MTPVVVAVGVVTCNTGDAGADGACIVMSSCGAGGAVLEMDEEPEPEEIVPEPPELIVCCDEASEPVAAGGSCGVVPSESPWALCSERDGAAGACC